MIIDTIKNHRRFQDNFMAICNFRRIPIPLILLSCVVFAHRSKQICSDDNGNRSQVRKVIASDRPNDGLISSAGR